LAILSLRPHHDCFSQASVESGDEALQLPAVGKMLHLQGMAGGVDVADPPPGSLFAAASLPLPVEPGGSGRRAGAGQCHSGDDLSLQVGEPPLSAIGLDQSADGDVVALGVEHVQKEMGESLLHAETFRIDPGKSEPIAGGTDHNIERLAGAVGEDNSGTLKALHTTGRHDAPGIDALIERVVDHRMGFPQPVVGLGKPMPPWEADGVVDGAQAQEAAQPQRQTQLEQALQAEIGRPAPDLAGRDKIRPACGVHGVRGMAGAFHRDVAA